MPEPEENQYSSLACFIYVFNIIVGAGALAMPNAFNETGLVLSAVIVTVLAFLSFMTSTFVLEAMALANGVLRQRALDADNLGSPVIASKESSRLLATSPSLQADADEPFKLTIKVEMGEMAHIFFNKIGLRFFYLCIVIYLYGDLAIYATAVPKSLEKVVCGFADGKGNTTEGDARCWGMATSSVYRIFVAIFALVVCPFTFTNLQKTKYLQYLTTFLRWFSFLTMIVLCFIRIAQDKGNKQTQPIFDVLGIPDLFGAAVYSFMCQHSLPSIVLPTKNKRHLTSILALDMTFALFFYAMLSFTALFAFYPSAIKDVYTLSFYGKTVVGIGDFLALYPVFALSTSFPIISITLRENLKALFRHKDDEFHWIIERVGFPLLAVLPPIVIALSTENVSLLVSVTGSYAGVGVQYVIPSMLVYCGRRMASEMFGEYRNEQQSLFKHSWWIYGILSWTLLCIAFVTTYNIKSRI